jgi:lysophospholipase L1-like esterase
MKRGVRNQESGIRRERVKSRSLATLGMTRGRILSTILVAGLSSLAQVPAQTAPQTTNQPAAQAAAQSGTPSATQAPNALLASKDLNEMCQRSAQLMEAGGISVPDLHNAAAPLIENAKQACIQLQATASAAAPTYTLLMNLRAYNALADSVPKPFPFPETASRQFAELRDRAGRLDAHFRALLASKEAQIVTPDRDNLERYTDANRKVQPPNPKNPRVVFIGDSITDGWRLNEYFPDRDFINRGISGQVTSQMLARFKADVIDLHPETVVILGGTNDLARGTPLISIENNYQMMSDLARDYRIKVIFASVLPVSDYHKADNALYERSITRPPIFINALNDWIEKLCQQRGHIYLDYFNVVRDNRGMLQADLSDDGLHPNSKGYRVMAPVVLEAIQKAMKPAPPPAPKVLPAKPPASRGTSK